MMCDDLVVLQAGKVVEAGPSQEIFRSRKADYTRALLDAVPYFEPQRAAAAGPRASRPAHCRERGTPVPLKVLKPMMRHWSGALRKEDERA